MLDDGEKKRIGNEIKQFLDVNGVDRETFGKQSGLSKSTIDKLVIGLFSEKTLNKVLNRSGFKLRTLYAAPQLGGYSKANWDGYISDYLMLRRALDASPTIEALIVSISWDDTLPGLVLATGYHGAKNSEQIGALWVPHERLPLIYVQPMNEIGVRLIVSTMVGEPVMRGLYLAVSNIVANAWIPVSTPVALLRLEEGHQLPPEELGRIQTDHEKYESYSAELNLVLQHKYAQVL